jgi:hypothetical protein
VVDAGSPVSLFDARRDMDDLLLPHFWEYVRYRMDYVEGTLPGRLALDVRVESFDPEPHHFALRSVLRASQKTRLGDVASGRATASLSIRARAVDGPRARLGVALVRQDGSAWGAVILLADAWTDIRVPLDSLRRVPLALLPRPYPQFLPYLFNSAGSSDVSDLSHLEGIQLSLEPDRVGQPGRDAGRGFQIEHVHLEFESSAPRSSR